MLSLMRRFDARVLIAEHQLYPRVVSQYLGRARDFDWISGRVGELALALPETRFQTSHGSPGWKVGSQSSGKFFAIMWNRHHGEDAVGVLVKCSGQDEMAQLIEAEPDLFSGLASEGKSQAGQHGNADDEAADAAQKGQSAGHQADAAKSDAVRSTPRLESAVLRAVPEAPPVVSRVGSPVDVDVDASTAGLPGEGDRPSASEDAADQRGMQASSVEIPLCTIASRCLLLTVGRFRTCIPRYSVRGSRT